MTQRKDDDTMNIKSEIRKEEETMTKERKERICMTCFLAASACWYFVSIVNLIEQDTTAAVLGLCLGSAFLCLSTTHMNKKGYNDKDHDEH